MNDSELNRRDFERLAMAALGGMLAGAGAALADDDDDDDDDDEKDKNKNPLLVEPHVCRGLNTCKAKGKDKKNACAGQGTCFTAEKHTCHAQNACKGKGECGVPLSDGAWKKARKRFEELMKKEGKKVGPAPKKK